MNAKNYFKKHKINLDEKELLNSSFSNNLYKGLNKKMFKKNKITWKKPFVVIVLFPIVNFCLAVIVVQIGFPSLIREIALCLIITSLILQLITVLFWDF